MAITTRGCFRRVGNFFSNSPARAKSSTLIAFSLRYHGKRLMPDTAHRLVIGAYGTYDDGNLDLTTASYCTPAWAPGFYALTYCPQNATLTVNMGELAGLVRARWCDPSNGAFILISGSPFHNSGFRQFRTPGYNHDGNPDWVLYLDLAVR